MSGEKIFGEGGERERGDSDGDKSTKNECILPGILMIRGERVREKNNIRGEEEKKRKKESRDNGSVVRKEKVIRKRGE